MSAALKPKHQRLVLLVIALVALIGAALLAAWALRNQASYFYVPSDIAADPPEPGQAVRLGGMVEHGSLKTAADGVTIDFVVGDGKARVPVRFTRDRARPVRRRLGRGRRGQAAAGRHVRGRQPARQARRELRAARARGHDRGAEARRRWRKPRMIAELGLAALWLAAALAALQLLAGVARRCARRARRWPALVRPGGGGAGRCCARSPSPRCCWLFARTDLSVQLVAHELAFGQAAGLQARRHVGQPRRLDAAVGHGDGAGRRADRAGRAAAARAHDAGDAGRAGLRRARLLRLPAVRPRTRSSG